MAFDRAAFLARYCDEADDHLRSIDDTLVALEATPGKAELLALTMRAMHTLKGASRMLKVSDVATVAHAAEDLLVAARDGRFQLGAEHVTLLSRASDLMREILGELRAGREGGFGEAVAGVAGELQDAAELAPAGDPPRSSRPLLGPERSLPTIAVPAAKPEKPVPAPPRKVAEDTVRVPVFKLDETIRLMEELASEQVASRHRLQELRRLRAGLRKVAAKVDRLGSGDGVADDVADLLAGFDRQVREERDSAGQRERLTSALQQHALEIRLMPIGELFGTLPRAVRDISNQLGKRVRLELAGLDIELDKRVLEGLQAPLIHLIRNAVDHGLEPADERVRANKEPEARLMVGASHQGGKVEIVVEDDGRGINLDGVKRTGLSRGLLPPDRADTATEREILDLLFMPGFSTAREVTDVSGRGVGLDVVKSHLEDLKGDVSVETTEGRGTAFRLTVPVSLTLQTVVRAAVGGGRYGFPHSFVEETRPVGHLDLIEVAGRPALRLGNQLIPVVDLAEALGGEPVASRRAVVIGHSGGDRVAFGVDGIEEIEEVVIKPVPRGLKAPLVGGFCVAEKGVVIPILHIPNLIKAVWRLGSRRVASRRALRAPRRILVVDDSPNTREVERIILESAGYRVDTAKDGEDALARISRRHYHLVVSDIEMPKMDGFTLCRRLREMPETAAMPIVLVTSRATEADKRRGADVGASAYIEKGSFDQDHLIQEVRALLAALPPDPAEDLEAESDEDLDLPPGEH